jgi:hypothetical protein
MPVYQYNKGDHPAGFIGLRVAVMVNGDHKQKYFNFKVPYSSHTYYSLKERDEMRAKAKALEESWQHQRKATATTREAKAEEVRPSLYSTGVRGIKMKFCRIKKQRAGEARIYYTPVFVVSGSTDKGRFHKDFNILTQGYQKAWISAVLYYFVKKNIDPNSPILKRLPPVEKFMVIFADQLKKGNPIPKHRLPTELWNNSLVRPALAAIN